MVTRDGVPVGELTRVRSRQFVNADAALAAFSDAPALDPERFRADVDSIVDQNAAPPA